MMDVIIVDDEQAGRRTLREFCEAEEDLRVVGEFGDGAAALTAIRLQRPQLLFLDIQMDPLNGIELARALEPVAAAFAGVRHCLRHLCQSRPSR
jgi:DNA-binding LytR/AlgR family response regulator